MLIEVFRIKTGLLKQANDHSDNSDCQLGTEVEYRRRKRKFDIGKERAKQHGIGIYSEFLNMSFLQKQESTVPKAIFMPVADI